MRQVPGPCPRKPPSLASSRSDCISCSRSTRTWGPNAQTHSLARFTRLYAIPGVAGVGAYTGCLKTSYVSIFSTYLDTSQHPGAHMQDTFNTTSCCKCLEKRDKNLLYPSFYLSFSPTFICNEEILDSFNVTFFLSRLFPLVFFLLYYHKIFVELKRLKNLMKKLINETIKFRIPDI